MRSTRRFSRLSGLFLEQGSTETLSLGVLVTIWSASRAVAAFQRSINQLMGLSAQTPFLAVSFHSYLFWSSSLQFY